MSGLTLVPLFQDFEQPRVRDIERRFIQPAGWQSVFIKGQWRWRHPDYSRSYSRGEAFARELTRQSK
jgi:hypothetical protein